MRGKGNRWYKADLHLHTTASQCFRDRNVTPEQWVERCIEQGLDCVAITDHNTGNNIDVFKSVAEEKGLVVFPGVELTFGENRIHLLVLFDCDKTTEYINDFLISVGIDREEFATPEACSNLKFEEILEKANEKGALVIPAHVDEFSGIQEASLDSIKKWNSYGDIVGVQVVNKELWELTESPSGIRKEEIAKILSDKYKTVITPEVVKNWYHPIVEARRNNKTILTFSDNPHAPGDSQHGLWGIGTRFTWIKMDEKASLDSLRQALLIGHYRVRNDFETANTPYNLPRSFIKSILIKNTHICQDEFKVEFSSQMTSIIGGRGTGKSSVVRFIRGILEKENELEEFEELLKDHSNFYSLRSNNDLGVLKDESNIELEIFFGGTLFKIIRNGSNKSIARWNGEEFQIEDFGYLKAYLNNCSIYSQKQIYEMAQNPNTLREKIDEADPEIIELKSKLQVLRNEYKEKTQRIRTLELKLEEKESLILQKNETLRRQEKLSAGSYKEILDKFSSLSMERQQYLNIPVLLNDKIQKFNEFKNLLDINFPRERWENKGEIELIIEQKLTDYKEMLEMVTSDFVKYVTELIAQYDREVKSSEWQSNFVAIKEQYDQLVVRLNPEEIEQLKNLSSLQDQLDSIEHKLAKLDEVEQAKSQLQVDQANLLDAYKAALNQITQKRRSFLQGIMSDSDNVKITVKPQRDFTNFLSDFRRIIQRPTGFDEAFKLIFQSLYSNATNLQDFKEIIYAINCNDNTTAFDGRFRRAILSINQEQLDDIKLLYPEDEIEVKYRPNNNSPFKSLSSASAGQKTSSILTFLLSYGDTPLILDQPEDDLDNQLIHNLIVDRLIKSKETRQIIVITHNANIPVNGDSEWVVALNSDSRDISVFDNGSVDKSNVKKVICDIMEGGEKAFELRALRYGFK